MLGWLKIVLQRLGVIVVLSKNAVLTERLSLVMCYIFHPLPKSITLQAKPPFVFLNAEEKGRFYLNSVTDSNPVTIYVFWRWEKIGG